MSTANYSEDKVFLQSYLEKLNGDEEENDEVDDSELIRTIKADLDTEDDDIAVQEDTSNVIMGADGRYYETSKNVVNVGETIKPSSKSPMRKIAGTIVTPVANKRKRSVPPAPDSIKKTKTTRNTRKKVIKEEEPNVKQRAANETIASEIDNQEEIYEFDENEQDPDNPPDISSAEYVSKGVIKNGNKPSTTTTSDETIYSCMICPYEAKKKFLFSRHLKTHSEERPYKCSVCERGFKTSTSLMNHQNVHLGIKPYACKDCDMAFTTSGELVRHVRYRHTHVKPHKCTECDYSSVEMSKLRRHMRCHTGERPYQCPHCTYASPDTFKLKRHMRTHTGEKPYECDICHARFTQSNSLKHHRLIHSVNEKPVFQCHLCPTTCGRKTDLRLHIKTLHSSDKPIPCKRCGKELPDRYSYKMHIKTHEGEKCFRCEFCPYASISQRHLESHTYIHLDTKPFMCEFCQTSFRQKALLARHMKVYHSDNYAPPTPRKKDHKCPHCSKTFAFKGNLIRHMEIHDPTSRVFEEKKLLKMGRMKRVQADGTVVAPQMEMSNEEIDETEEYYFELNEGEQQQQEEQDQQVEDDEEIQEVQYEDVDEVEEYNGNNIQYVYDEFEEDGYEEEEIPQEGEEFVIQEVKTERNEQIQNIIDIKSEKVTTMQNINVKTMDNDDNLEFLTITENEEQDFMVIEVLPDEDDADHEQIKHELIQSLPASTATQNKPAILNKKAHKANPKKAKTTTTQQPLISDYFGFEVDAEEDEQDEDTKGAIKLLEMIDQE